MLAVGPRVTERARGHVTTLGDCLYFEVEVGVTRLGVADTVVDYRDRRAPTGDVVLLLEPGHVDLSEPVGEVVLLVDAHVRGLLDRGRVGHLGVRGDPDDTVDCGEVGRVDGTQVDTHRDDVTDPERVPNRHTVHRRSGVGDRTECRLGVCLQGRRVDLVGVERRIADVTVDNQQRHGRSVALFEFVRDDGLCVR